MRARFATLPLVALMCATLAGSATSRASSPSAARLLDIRPHATGGRVAVLIEASAPVAYAASQPDPLTVLVDLRGVDAQGARNRFAASTGPVAAVSVEQHAASDGIGVARVRLGLNAPATPTVRSERSTIRVEFDEDASAAVRVLGTPAPTAPVAGGPATVLSRVGASVADGHVRITLAGNGRVEPGTVEFAKDAPPRLFIDLPGVAPTAPAVTRVAAHDVEKVRVAANSASPQVTRVVVDLTRKVSYRIERAGEQGHDLAIVFGAVDPTPKAAARPATAAPPAKPGTPKAPAPVAAPETASVAKAPAAGAKPVETTPKPAAAAPVKSDAALAKTEKSAAPAPTPPATSVAAEAVQSPAPPPANAAAKAIIASSQAEQRFTGHPVSLDFQGVDLRAVLRTFAEITGLNIVIDPAVQGTVDVSLRDVPWDQALEIILRANQLGYSVEGNIVRIAPFRVLADEESQRRKLADERALSGELKVLTKTLSYARASQLAQLVTRTALSSRGTVQVDERTNTLIITDLEPRLETATQLLATLDRPEPQVEIEARIVQTTREFARSIGVQWGINGRMAPELGNTSGLAFPNQGAISGRVGGVQGELGTSTAVNHAATAANSAIGVALGSINGAFNLDVAISALEKQGKGRVLSTPRVSTQNNVEAEVTQGIQIPIQTVANNTVTVSFKDAALTLRVKPQITAANTVIMKITLENASPDFSRMVNGIPPIDTQRANTEVLVSDGFTTVIGGIFVSREATVNDRTPGLHRLPLLGWLFKKDTIADESRELLIFITPRIIKS